MSEAKLKVIEVVPMNTIVCLVEDEQGVKQWFIRSWPNTPDPEFNAGYMWLQGNLHGLEYRKLDEAECSKYDEALFPLLVDYVAQEAGEEAVVSVVEGSAA